MQTVHLHNGHPSYWDARIDVEYCTIPFDGPYTWVVYKLINIYSDKPDRYNRFYQEAKNNFWIEILDSDKVEEHIESVKSRPSSIASSTSSFTKKDSFVEVKMLSIENTNRMYYNSRTIANVMLIGATNNVKTHSTQINFPALVDLDPAKHNVIVAPDFSGSFKNDFEKYNYLPVKLSLELPKCKFTQEEHLKMQGPGPLLGRIGKFVFDKVDYFQKLFNCYPWEARDLTSLAKVETTTPIKVHIEKLKVERPDLLTFLGYLHNKKSINKSTNNQLLLAFYKHVGADYDAFVAGLDHALTSFYDLKSSSYKIPISREAVQCLPGVSDKIVEKKAKAQWQFAQGAKAKSALLGIAENKHPLLSAALESGEVKFSLFHVSGDENKLINTEFDIIEAALAKPGWRDSIIAIMASAQSRTTYSKRVTNYFAFILYTLPRYLDRNAPLKSPGKSRKKRNWSCMPKFVNSQWELEMNDDDKTPEGTTKKRSALTPVADSDTGVVSVPYCSMAITGAFTTWCYSDLYTVVEQGQEDPISSIGGSYSADLAEKLNGRDDYGLCFYTLNGTSRNQGYPTFLIIFERTSAHGTRVHFHRVHPCRARGPNGTETPPHKLIEECYRYMAGNVLSTEIAHQQGDLLLIPCGGPGKAVDLAIDVFGFENHKFVSKSNTPVQLVKATGKTRGNLLGYLYSDEGMNMPHPEHEPINDIKAGWYELKRCKSYENNPTGAWSLNID